MPETEGQRAQRIRNLLLNACPTGVTTSEAALESVATEASHLKRRPSHLATPRTEAECVDLVKAAAKAELRVTPRGAGTSMAGQSIGKHLIIDTSRRMRRIQDPDERKRTISAQPGAVLDSIHQRLEETVWTVWPDPSSRDRATLGGMVGNNASGIHGLGYGATIDNVVSLKAVLADGTLVDTADPKLREREPFLSVEKLLLENAALLTRHAPKVAKNSSGYRLLEAIAGGTLDPTKLLIGAEGTLGLVTEVTWKLHRKPAKAGLLVSGFPNTEAAVAALSELLALKPVALELVDAMALSLVRRAKPEVVAAFGEQVTTLLLTEFHGDESDQVNGGLEQAHAACEAAGALVQQSSTEPAKQEALWAARRGMEPMVAEADPERMVLATMEDPCVPVERVGALIQGLQRLVAEREWAGAAYGHVGQGNLHFRALYDPKDSEAPAKRRSAEEQFYAMLKELAGSASGEHGDGSMRVRAIQDLWGPIYPLFVQVKQLMDPRWTFNPGVKVLKH